MEVGIRTLFSSARHGGERPRNLFWMRFTPGEKATCMTLWYAGRGPQVVSTPWRRWVSN